MFEVVITVLCRPVYDIAQREFASRHKFSGARVKGYMSKKFKKRKQFPEILHLSGLALLLKMYQMCSYK
jgi:hypothetical protein